MAFTIGCPGNKDLRIGDSYLRLGDKLGGKRNHCLYNDSIIWSTVKVPGR
jgi:hypothetical protein